MWTVEEQDQQSTPRQRRALYRWGLKEIAPLLQYVTIKEAGAIIEILIAASKRKDEAEGEEILGDIDDR